MPFKTQYFDTRQQALDYFNKVSRDHIAFFALDRECNLYFVANEKDYRSLQKDFNLDMSLELCSE